MQTVTAETIYRDYYKKICGFVYKKVGDSNAAEDLVSDIFLKITANINRFDPEKAAVSTWVYTIANNTVLDYYRTRKIHGQLPEDNGENGALPESLVESKGLDAGLLEEEQLEELADALAKLPERSRDIIILHYYGNMTLKEVAFKMGMSYANIKIVHKKAIQELKRLMTDL